MRPLFVEVPSLGDDVREILGGIVGEAVRQAKPPRIELPDPPVVIIREFLSRPPWARQLGYDLSYVRAEPTTDQILIDLRCPLCHGTVETRMTYPELMWDAEPNAEPIRAKLVVRVARAMAAHVCKLALGPSGRPARR